MKNPTILKDELSILKADKSAVLIEIRGRSDELKGILSQIEEAEKSLSDINNKIAKETARREEISNRAISLSKQVERATDKVKGLRQKAEVERIKYSQETKLHLGRIREYKKEELELTEKIEELTATYNRNVNALNLNLTELEQKLRTVGVEHKNKHKELQEAKLELKKTRDEDKKIMKERLKREDKIRNREKALKRKEQALEKREEDVQKMASDLMVVYFRIKELYAKVDPSMDIDKIITKVE